MSDFFGDSGLIISKDGDNSVSIPPDIINDTASVDNSFDAYTDDRNEKRIRESKLKANDITYNTVQTSSFLENEDKKTKQTSAYIEEDEEVPDFILDDKHDEYRPPRNDDRDRDRYRDRERDREHHDYSKVDMRTQDPSVDAEKESSRYGEPTFVDEKQAKRFYLMNLMEMERKHNIPILTERGEKYSFKTQLDVLREEYRFHYTNIQRKISIREYKGYLKFGVWALEKGSNTFVTPKYPNISIDGYAAYIEEQMDEVFEPKLERIFNVYGQAGEYLDPIVDLGKTLAVSLIEYSGKQLRKIQKLKELLVNWNNELLIQLFNNSNNKPKNNMNRMYQMRENSINNN
jgi:hypothetical protein